MSLFSEIEKYKDNIALISDSIKPITYQDLQKDSYVIKKHIPPRSFTLLISENSVGALVSYISLIKNDSVTMLTDFRTKKPDILNLISIYKPDFLIGPDDLIKNLKLANYKSLENIYNYCICKSENKNIEKINNNLSLLLPTSGSMGSPKFARLSKENLKENAKSIIDYLKITKNKRSITTMPFSYSFMMSIINTFIESGASIYVTNHSLVEKEFWKGYEKNKITSFSGVPYIFENLIKLGLEKVYTESLQEFTQAGGKLHKESLKKMINFCENKNLKLTVMYGQTEASPRITYLDWKFSSNKMGSIGKAIPETKIWLKNDDGKKIKKSKVAGELIVEGKNVCLGYANSFNDLKKGDDNKGILDTGDLAYFDEDGFFYITGRKNRIAKLFGNRINLDEIEEKMSQKGFRVACKYDDNKVITFFEKKYSKQDVLKTISDITDQHSTGFLCVTLDKLPITISGKVEYSKLKN